MPFIILVAFAVKKKVLRFRFFNRSLGKLWEHLKINDRLTRLYFFWHYLRRILYFLVLVLLNGTNFENVQLGFNFYLNLITLIFVSFTKAFKNKNLNKIDILNEFLICFINFQILGCSDMVENVKT